MAEEVAKLKATIEIDTKSAQNSVNIINQRIDTLNKKMQEGEKLTAKENAELKRLVKTLADLGNSANKTQIAEEKMRATREKSANEVKNKSIINEQKLATERERTKKATIQSEQAELRLAKQKDSLSKKNFSLRDSIVQATTKSWLYIKAISALTESFASGSKEAVNFQRDMSQVNTLTNFNKDDLKSYSKEVGNLGVEMGKMPSEMAKGMYTVQSIVDESADSMWVLREATKASIASNTNLSDTVDTGMGIVNAYGFEISDLTKVYDAMFTTFDIGNVTMEELSQHLGNVVSSAVKAKVPFETFMGQLAFLTARGMKTAEATTALARGYDAIYEKKDVLKEVLGVDVEENGKLRDTTVILGEIGEKLQEYDDISKISIVQKLGLQERADKYFTFMSQEADKAQQTIDKVSNSLGKTETAYNNATDNISTEIAKTKASIVMDFNEMITANETLIRFFIKLGKVVGIIATGIVEAFKTPIDLFFKLATFGQTTGFQDWLIKTQTLLKKFGIGTSKTTDEVKEKIKEIEKTLNETNTAVNKFNGKTLVDPKHAKSVKTEVDKIVSEYEKLKKATKDNKTVVGTELQKTLDFYSNFTKGMSLEIKNQVAIQAALGSAESIIRLQQEKWKKSNYTPTKQETSELYSRAGKQAEIEFATMQTVLGIKPKTASKIDDGKDGSSGSGNGGTKEEFSYSKALSEFKLEMDTQGIKEGTEKYLEEYKSFLESSTKSLIDLGSEGTKDLSTVKTEYAKVKSQLDALGKYNYTKEYSNFLALMKGKGIQEGTEEFNNEYKKFLENSVEKMVEQKQDTSEITKKLEQINLKEETSKHLKAYNDIFKEEEQFADNIKKTGQDINTEENIQKVVEIWEKQIEGLIELADGSDQFNTQIADISANINKYKKTDKTGYNTTEYEDEFTVAFRGKNSVESMNSTYDTLFEKYKGNTEALELLTDIYNNQTGSIETFSDKLSASAGFVSELSSVLDNEFLSSLANAMNGISSMSSVIGNAGGIANLGFGGWMSIATSAISIASSIGLFGGDDAEEQQRQAEINRNFQDAVNTFEQAVEDFSSKEKIDLANILEGFGGINVSEVGLWTDIGYNSSSLHNSLDAPLISSELEKYISENFGLDLDVDPILRKYNYNVADTIEYLNSLIKDSYQINLDAYKEQVGLASDSFVSAIKEGMENATDLDITSMIESAFYDSYSAMIGEVFGENIGDTISETIFDVLENSGVTQSDLANMSVSEQIAYIQSLMDNSSTYLSEVFEQLGLSASKVSEEFDSLSNQDLPSLVKIGAFEALASNNYTSSTTINVASVYGSVDRTFVNLTNTAVNSTTNKRTLN